MAKKRAAAPSFALEHVRNIGIIAHIDAGKTTTTEQIYYYTGSVHRVGSVDDGNTITDWDPQEQEKGITIVSAAVTTHWQPPGGEPHRINIIDTPGHIDFTAEVERALSVLDGAIGIFCAVGGVQAQSETVWRQADAYGVPRIAYVNKLDRSGADYFEVLKDIGARLEGSPLAVQIPIGREKDFRGVVDLVTMKAWIWHGDEAPLPPPTEEEVPADLLEEAQLYREELVDRLGDIDDELAGRVIEELPIEPEHVRAALRRVTLARSAFPVLCGASFRHKGVQPLLDAICHYLPSPGDRPPVQGKRPRGKRIKDGGDREGWLDAIREPKRSAPFCALAFKTDSTPHGRAGLFADLLGLGDAR